jgi:cytochrome b561
MSDAAAPKRYPDSAILLHWLVLILVVAAYTCILLRTNFERGSDIREGLKAGHFMLGLSVLAATFLRICLRFMVWKTPPITPSLPPILHLLSIAAHLAIYAWLIGMPFAGWTILSAEGDPITFWGLNVQPLTSPDKALAEQVKELHETSGTIGYLLLGLHAAAALFHHYFMKDDTLRRMLPSRLH